ncbi:cysteine proteinase [Choiromyces venosus 120613-1]|uniref:ubiquitinyl hydrolase 1 n=1 Tax=Choiromyces venosus 120613-1 TaxID=1336337 RepID=A0A3N4JF68_9PEZI|nr:cysteine proteinase [Choiromyces venosus 120613-1]
MASRNPIKRINFDPAPCTAPEIRSMVKQKENWGGWATTLNDAPILEYIMRQVGCDDIAVKELYSMEEEYLELEKSCYGIIFLMPYNEHYETVSGEELSTLPDGMWYSNQMADNACASYALLNILMNLKGVPLGTQLEGFREFTKDLLPPHRGQAVDSFTSIKNAHNSFCFRYEIEDADMTLFDEAYPEDVKPEPKSKGRKARATSEEQQAAQDQVDQIQGPHHYIAYVRVAGSLWELDGLKQTPFKLGPCDPDNFAACVGKRMRELTSRCKDMSIDFAIFALEAARGSKLEEQHQENARAIGAVERRLQEINSESCLSMEAMKSGIFVLQPLPTETFTHLSELTEQQLLEHRAALIQKQREVEVEMDQLFNEESRKAVELARNRHDYEPFIFEMAAMVFERQMEEKANKPKPTPKPKRKAKKGGC